MEHSDDAERWKVVTGPRKRRVAKGGVLGDHRRVGKRFVPPFVAMLGQLQYVKWIDDLLPEVLWLASAHRAGARRPSRDDQWLPESRRHRGVRPRPAGRIKTKTGHFRGGVHRPRGKTGNYERGGVHRPHTPVTAEPSPERECL